MPRAPSKKNGPENKRPKTKTRPAKPRKKAPVSPRKRAAIKRRKTTRKGANTPYIVTVQHPTRNVFADALFMSLAAGAVGVEGFSALPVREGEGTYLYLRTDTEKKMRDIRDHIQSHMRDMPKFAREGVKITSKHETSR